MHNLQGSTKEKFGYCMSSIGNNETCGCLNFVGAPSLIQSVSRQGKRTFDPPNSHHSSIPFWILAGWRSWQLLLPRISTYILYMCIQDSEHFWWYLSFTTVIIHMRVWNWSTFAATKHDWTTRVSTSMIPFFFEQGGKKNPLLQPSTNNIPVSATLTYDFWNTTNDR
jgi:hypothetical protein